MARVFPDETAHRLYLLCVAYLRRPVGIATDDVSGLPVVEFTPALSGPEQTIYDRLLRIARSTIPSITPAEWEALEPDIDGLRTYQGLPSPTLAQTVLAVKAQSRILRALLRD